MKLIRISSFFLGKQVFIRNISSTTVLAVDQRCLQNEAEFTCHLNNFKRNIKLVDVKLILTGFIYSLGSLHALILKVILCCKEF